MPSILETAESAGARAATARLRLAACAIAALLLAGLSCRPSWSADGHRITFAAIEGKKHFLAEHDFEAETTRKVCAIGPADGATRFLPRGDGWVAVTADGGDDNVVVVQTLAADGSWGEDHRIRVKTRNLMTILQDPVLVGDDVLLQSGTLLRVHVETGETTESDERGLVAVPFGDRAGYVKAGSGPWEIGELDPKTFERTPWLARPADCPWDVLPHARFNRALDRCAVVGVQGQQSISLDSLKWALLVFEKGSLISTIELGTDMSAGPVAWIDDVTLCATIMRPGDDVDTFALVETSFNGAGLRETAVLKAPVHEKMAKNGGVAYAINMPFLLAPAPSPDGKKVAFTTAKLPEFPTDLAGLLVLDRSDARVVTRVPFTLSRK